MQPEMQGDEVEAGEETCDIGGLGLEIKRLELSEKLRRQRIELGGADSVDRVKERHLKV